MLVPGESPNWRMTVRISLGNAVKLVTLPPPPSEVLTAVPTIQYGVVPPGMACVPPCNQHDVPATNSIDLYHAYSAPIAAFGSVGNATCGATGVSASTGKSAVDAPDVNAWLPSRWLITPPAVTPVYSV